MSLKTFLREQITEIEADPQLKAYAFFLILIHFWTAIFWYQQDLANIIGSQTETLCWPVFPNCDLVNSWLAPYGHFILPVYLSLTLGALLIQSSSLRWGALIALEVLKLAITFLSYRLMGNYHFMAHIVTLFFLFAPYKKFWIKIWILSFYLSAASLKFNFEWLSGGSLSWKVPFQDTFLLQIGAVLVLILELTAPWYLFSRHLKLKFSALAALCVFHLISYYWVGFFYPTIMLTLLSIFFLEIQEPVKAKGFYSIENWRFLVGFVPWVSFIAAQILSFGHPREYSLTGSDRLFTLNMYDARSVCKGFFIIHHGVDSVQVAFRNEDIGIRIQCDPIVFLEQGRKLCQSQKKSEPIEAYLVSKRWTDIDTLTTIRENDLCRKWE